MLKLIIFKELREVIGSAKFVATFGICSILIILAFFAGIKNYETSLEEYNASTAANLRTYKDTTDWDHVRDHRIVLTPMPLASLIIGLSNDVPRAAYINGRDLPSLSTSNYSQQPVFSVFRFLDLEFVFQVILSLFAILFAFDAINGEKERGTLRLSFANSLPRAGYILGKLAGSFLALALPLIIPILIGVLMVSVMGISLTADEWIRLGLFILCGMLYLGVFLTLSVFISCLTQRPSSSFLFLLVIWVCSVLIIPRASVLIAGNTVEVPSAEEISVKRLQLQRQNARTADEKFGEAFQQFLKELRQGNDKSPEFQKRRQEELYAEVDKLRAKLDKDLNDFTDRLNEERHNKQIKQEKLAFGISRISPAAVFTLAATTLSDTSMELRNHFMESAQAYSKSFADFFRDKTGKSIDSKMVFDMDQEEKKKQQLPIDINEIPEFVYQAPDLSTILHDALPDIALLILFNLVFFTGAFTAFMRYDLR
ncbi:MAG: ABC transporter permease subunit [Deltaproteobacteria bacterium]|nr:ABC transporter permease subunit [Deltaproteobacteria bacterium]